jgi:hypothetical protein
LPGGGWFHGLHVLMLGTRVKKPREESHRLACNLLVDVGRIRP